MRINTMDSHNRVPERVSNLELFFDLVFVFTITQVAEVVVHHPDLSGVGHAAIELSILAWMFGGYAWLTNSASVVTSSCRSVLLVEMAAFFICASENTPTAFLSEPDVNVCTSFEVWPKCQYCG